MLEALRIILTSDTRQRDDLSAHRLEEQPTASSVDATDGGSAVKQPEDQTPSVADG